MASAKKKTTLKEKLTNTNTKLRRFLLWSFFIALSIVIVMFNYWQAQVSIDVGDVATEDIFYEQANTSYVSAIRTEAARKAAAAAVNPVYKIDNSSLNNNLAVIETYFAAFEEYMLYNNPDVELKPQESVDPDGGENEATDEENGETGNEEEGDTQNEEENSEGDTETDSDTGTDSDTETEPEPEPEPEPAAPSAPRVTYDDLVYKAMYFMRYTDLGDAERAQKQKVIEYIISMSQAEFVLAKKSLQNAITDVVQPGVTEDELPGAKMLIENNIRTASLPESAIEFLLDLYGNCRIEANKFYDAVATAAEVEAAQEGVQPVSVTVMKGERIVTRGTVVTELQIEALKSLNMLRDKPRLLPYVGIIALIVLFYLLLILYVRSYYSHTRKRESNIILMGILINFILLLAKAISMIDLADTQVSLQLGYLLPVAAASMLLTLLIGPGVAVIISFFVSVFSGLLLDGGIYCTVVAMVGSVTGVLCSRDLNQRGQFVRASLYLALANMIAISAINLITEQSYQTLAIGVGFGFINGLISAVLAMGFLPFMESGFKITTPARLTELANSNNPLLKRLMLEAPGTYHHSVLVGNLAETAADAIGADPLLTRVSAYYHDVGKLKRPYFFTENQQPDDNPHDKLSPSLSAMIITSHVKDGVEMLRENRFPKEIVDAALSHHGTSVLSFFYHKALEQAEDPETVNKDDYTYRGKLPDTKELALVSLADAVQAAVQALNTNDTEAIERRVRSVIKSKIDEGQLAAAPLTFADIELTTQNFVRVLSGMTHSRIEYPEQVAREMAEKNAGEAEGGQK